MITLTEENYIKAIYHLGKQGAEVVSTNAISESIQTKASSVSDMLKKLSEKGYANYVKYQGVNLTEKGQSIAINIIRKHRLWDKHGNFKHIEKIMLSQAIIGKTYKCVGVDDTSSAFLKYLDSNKIALGTKIVVVQKEPYDNSVKIKFGEHELMVSQNVAKNLFLKEV